MTEMVWREDIEKEVEYLTEGCRTVSTYYHHAKSQGAPGPLLDEMALVWKDLDQARQRLQNITICFPEEKRR